MRKTHMIVAGTALTLSLAGWVSLAQAQDPAHVSNPAQLQREHVRAMKANDPANDPYNPASSNDLNRKQLDRANALGNAPTGIAGDAPVDINSQASTTDNSSVPANSMASTSHTTATGDTPNPTDDSTVPPSGPDMKSDMSQQNMPMQNAPTEDKGKAGSNSNPADATDSPPSPQ